jgi:phosphatidylglycerophosphatase A
MKPDTEAAAIPAPSTKKPSISILLASWFGAGYLPKAPGTFGSIGGAILALLMNWLALRSLFESDNGSVRVTHYFGARLLASYALVLIIAIVGVIASDRAARFTQIKDPQWIVIDEVSGQLLTYYLFFLTTPLNWKCLLLGFILFRLFDIWKPFPARQLENLPGGWGIMADDWMAGIYAALLLQVALHFRLL